MIFRSVGVEHRHDDRDPLPLSPHPLNLAQLHLQRLADEQRLSGAAVSPEEDVLRSGQGTSQRQPLYQPPLMGVQPRVRVACERASIIEEGYYGLTVGGHLAWSRNMPFNPLQDGR